MLSRVDAADGGRADAVRVAHAEGVREAPAAVCHADLSGGGDHANHGPDRAGVGDSLGHGDRGGARTRNHEVVKVKSKLPKISNTNCTPMFK